MLNPYYFYVTIREEMSVIVLYLWLSNRNCISVLLSQVKKKVQKVVEMNQNTTKPDSGKQNKNLHAWKPDTARYAHYYFNYFYYFFSILFSYSFSIVLIVCFRLLSFAVRDRENAALQLLRWASYQSAHERVRLRCHPYALPAVHCLTSAVPCETCIALPNAAKARNGIVSLYSGHNHKHTGQGSAWIRLRWVTPACWFDWVPSDHLQ